MSAIRLISNLGGALMKRMVFFHSGVLAGIILLVPASGFCQNVSKPAESDASKLVYADFQNVENGRPVSKKGGMMRLNHYSLDESDPPQCPRLEKANRAR